VNSDETTRITRPAALPIGTIGGPPAGDVVGAGTWLGLGLPLITPMLGTSDPADASPAPAEELRLSYSGALERALAAGTASRLARSSEERARAAILESRAALLPETEARLLRYNQSINLATFGFAQPGQNAIAGPFNVTDAQISAAMNLFDLASLRRYQAARAAWRLGDIPTVWVEMRAVREAAEEVGDTPTEARACTALAGAARARWTRASNAQIPRRSSMADVLTLLRACDPAADGTTISE